MQNTKKIQQIVGLIYKSPSLPTTTMYNCNHKKLVTKDSKINEEFEKKYNSQKDQEQSKEQQFYNSNYKKTKFMHLYDKTNNSMFTLVTTSKYQNDHSEKVLEKLARLVNYCLCDCVNQVQKDLVSEQVSKEKFVEITKDQLKAVLQKESINEQVCFKLIQQLSQLIDISFEQLTDSLNGSQQFDVQQQKKNTIFQQDGAIAARTLFEYLLQTELFQIQYQSPEQLHILNQNLSFGEKLKQTFTCTHTSAKKDHEIFIIEKSEKK